MLYFSYLYLFCDVWLNYSIVSYEVIILEYYADWLIVDLLRYDNFVVCYTESYPQRIRMGWNGPSQPQ